jgi:hypothetical protein
MDVYYGTELSAVVHTNYAPLRENPHLEPRFPDGGWVGRFRFLEPWPRRLDRKLDRNSTGYSTGYLDSYSTDLDRPRQKPP